MKFLYDFFPILLFFIAYKMYGIYAATVVAIVASVLQVGLFWLKHKRFENMHLITMGLIVVFGGLTLVLHDETFIKWKPTVINWLFGVVFIGSGFIGKKTLSERLMGSAITVPGEIWSKLNWAWGLFFLFLGGVNLFVMYNFDTDTWVNFKLFGMVGLTFAFVIAQSFYLARHIEEDDEYTATDAVAPKEES